MGNQLNTDIVGAQTVGIATVYVTDAIYRSSDEVPTPEAKPKFTIPTLFELPNLVEGLLRDTTRQGLCVRSGAAPLLRYQGMMSRPGWCR